ncbi:MAG: GDP-perosamine N-acetyltransferase [Nitrosomonadaceae bacterium]|nr:GDP-perosamine N-acetyltransferase [Nitrosomonadaceae bacterium]
MIKNIVVIGTGGLAREFTSYFSEYPEPFSIIGFSGINHEEHHAFSLPGVLFMGDITPDLVGTDEAIIAIGNPVLKKKLSEKLRSVGFRFPSFVHPKSVVSDRASLGEGVVISPNCTVAPNVELKSFSYLNFGVGVGHDAIVGQYCQANPGAQLGGFTCIGDGTLIGSGAVILHRVKVGSNVTIASGSVVFSRVSDGATMMGNPAKRMRAFEK